MRALLDINVLIALMDPDHTFHERAHAWWGVNAVQGWSSCPITENGVVRIMSNPNYSRQMRLTPHDLIKRLVAFVTQTDHAFWPDTLSLRDSAAFAADHVHSSKQLTDIYLLGLAARYHGRLATFDAGIPLSAVLAARSDTLCVL